MPSWLVAWIALASLVGFAAMGLDKRAARRGRGRTSERALLAIALAGGSPGVALGMVAFRHKTRKLGFVLAFLAIVGAQALAVLLTRR